MLAYSVMKIKANFSFLCTDLSQLLQYSWQKCKVRQKAETLNTWPDTAVCNYTELRLAQ